MADEAGRQRLQKDAHALSGLSHPKVASAYHFGTREDVDIPVMETSPGFSLDEKLRDCTLSAAETANQGPQRPSLASSHHSSAG